MQSPFASLFIYFEEAKPGQDREDLVLVTKEILKQRIKGIKNKAGTWVAPTFPKILYVLSENNCKEGTPYWEVTKLAAECTAKRMVPDYISEKKMKEYKEGNVYGCMGCTDPDELVTYKLNDFLYVESMQRLWKRIVNLIGYSNVKGQNSDDDYNRYIDTRLLNLKIYDTKNKDFVKVNCMNRNVSNKWLTVKLSNGRIVDVTDDHPFTTDVEDVVHAKELKPGMKILCDYSQYSEENYKLDPEYTWLLGVFLADGCYDHQLSVTIDAETENDIETAFMDRTKRFFNIDFKTKLHSRGDKGIYKELYANNTTDDKSIREQKFLRKDLLQIFGGKEKVNRQIPAQAFNFDYTARLGLLAGLIDADGYIHPDTNIVMLGSTNKELALGQLALAQSCGMKAKISHNYYRSNRSDKVRYSVTFYPSEDLTKYIVCEKKKKNIDLSKIFINITDNVQYNEVVEVIENHRILNKDGWQYSYDVTTDSEHFSFSGIYSHNCRSFLSVWKDPETNKPKFWGRFNKGVVTINLPDVAFTIRDKYGDNSFNNNAAVAEFWKLLDERLEMCHRALLMRCRYLEGTPSDVAPILWQAGAIARLKPGETIDKLLKGGYSTASLGYVGLWETSKALSGKRHTDPEMIEFCKQIVKHMKEKCDEWNEIPDQNYGFSLYGTPEESTTFKFAKRLMTHKTLLGVNDKNYIMNSYHMDIREGLNHGVDAFTKLSTESEFQKYTNGGAVSYVETSHMENNIPAVLAIMDHIYENILYAEINSKFDNCHKCGYSGEIELVDNGKGHLIWKCPNCGNTDTAEMTIIRRICGYCAGANDMNEGRKGDIKGRELNV